MGGAGWSEEQRTVCTPWCLGGCQREDTDSNPVVCGDHHMTRVSMHPETKAPVLGPCADLETFFFVRRCGVIRMSQAQSQNCHIEWLLSLLTSTLCKKLSGMRVPGIITTPSPGYVKSFGAGIRGSGTTGGRTLAS